VRMRDHEQLMDTKAKRKARGLTRLVHDLGGTDHEGAPF
jgi:hypothetical protein